MASNFPYRSMSRRRFLHGLIGGAGVVIAAQLLAACGDGSPADAPTSGPADATSGAGLTPRAPATTRGTSGIRIFLLTFSH